MSSYDTLRQSSNAPFFVIAQSDDVLNARPLKDADNIDPTKNKVQSYSGTLVKPNTKLLHQPNIIRCHSLYTVFINRIEKSVKPMSIRRSRVFSVELGSNAIGALGVFEKRIFSHFFCTLLKHVFFLNN